MNHLLTPSEYKKILLKYDVELINSEILSVSNDNFLLKFIVRDGDKESVLKFFAKPTLKSPGFYHMINDLKEAGVAFDPEIVPQLVYEKHNLQVFEDLTCQEFQVCPNVFDLDHIKIVLRALSKLHSGSLVFEDKTDSRLDQKYNVQYSDNNSCPDFRRALSHGDLRSENVMFKYQNEKPVECRLINFKGIQYMPPIHDVLQVIYLNTSERFRQDHLEDLILYYHECLPEKVQQKFLNLEILKKQTHYFLPIIKKAYCWPILSREDFYVIIKNKIGTSDYRLLESTLTPLNEANGYMCNYQKLTLKVDHKFEETINCFVKTLPRNMCSLKIIRETGCFNKEVFFYQTLVPQMLTLGIDTIAECVAQCYFQRAEDVIVFDDLTKKNYRPLPSQKPFDFTLLSISVKKLAQFHASTIVFEEKMSEKLSKRYRLGEVHEKYLREVFFTNEENHAGTILMKIAIQSIVHLADLFPDLKTEANQNNLIKCWNKLNELYYNLTKPSNCYRNVFSHGDLWTNNIMIKFDGDTPTDCVFVDFQITRYCPPAHDFLCVMYLTTNAATRTKFEDEMKQLYFEEIVKTLNLYGYGQVFSFEEFIESVEYIRPQMVLQAIAYKMFCLATSEDISSFLTNDEMSNFVFFEDRKDYLVNICKRSEVVKDNLKECLLDLYALCEKLVVS